VPTYDVGIIGGGISGLAALHYLRSRRPELSVRLFEAESRLGGTIGTDLVDGHSFDWGPNGFLDREPLTLQLCHDLDLDNDLERANENVKNRFILRRDVLRAVPMSPLRFMASDILSLSGRLRILAEPFARGGSDSDESIYEFVSRRIGREAADYLVQPMVSGVYGGLADRLSLKSCFPIMHEMESQYGSLIKAMIAKARAAKRAGKRSGGPSGPGGWLTSFKGGLQRLVDRPAERYADHIQTDTPVTSITRADDRYVLSVDTGENVTAKRIIVATPAHRAADLLGELSPSLGVELEAIPYAPIAVVCLGVQDSDVAHSLDGFGFLVPPKENKSILGSIWTSSIFANRSPQGQVQLRSMLGGDGNHAVVDMSDDELVNRTIEDLRDVIGLSLPPTTARVYRWHRGIPQYVIGHQARLQRIEKELARFGNVHLAGNSYYGIGLNDCIKQAYQVVDSIA